MFREISSAQAGDLREDAGQAAGKYDDLWQLSLADPLTGLANRMLLLDRLTRELTRRRRHGGCVIVSHIDLDNLKDINDEFAGTDVALVIGANDVVNPAARTDKSSPIYGMPILNADKSKKVYVVKRGEGKGYAGIVNALFYGDNCDMVYGDAAAVLTKMIEAVRALGTKAAA